jgi:hypothetical protein
MKKRIDNIDLLIAARDLIKSGLTNAIVYDAVCPNKNLPDEFILVKAGRQFDGGNVDVDGIVEVCVYARNLDGNDDNTQPDLHRLKPLTESVYAILFDAQKNGIFFQDTEITLVKDGDIGYFYNSLIIETKSINLKYYK